MQPAALSKLIRRLRAPTVALLVLAAALACLTFFAPVSNTGSDPRYSLLTSQAILQYGTIRLDAYRDTGRLPENDARLVLIDGHTYYYSALGTPLLALPMVWVANRLGLDMANGDDEAQAQRPLAALLCALTLILAAAVARCYVAPWPALVIAAILVFGTTLTSALGTALWNINFTVVLLLLCLLLLARYDVGDTLTPHPWLLGTLLFVAYLCRPTTLLLVVLVWLYLLARSRRASTQVTARAVAAFVIPLALFALYSSDEYGLPLPPYYLPEQHGMSSAHFLNGVPGGGEGRSLLVVLYGLLLSPSRGLFVYSPMLLVALLAAPLALLQRGRRLITLLALAWIGAHIALLLRHNIWWGGHGYGPRLSTDVIPAFILLAPVTWAALAEKHMAALRALTAAAFVLTGAFAIALHSYVGLYNLQTLYWNGGIMPPELAPPQVFEWRYPQFAASERSNCARNAEYMEGLLRSGRADLLAYAPGDDIDANDAEDYRPVALDPLWQTHVLRFPWQQAAPPENAPALSEEGRLYLPLAANRTRASGPLMLSALFVGWSSLRGETVTSLCENASILIGPLPQDALRDPAQLTLELATPTAQEVEARVNGEAIARFRLEPNPDGAMEQVQLPFDATLLSTNSVNRITLGLLRGPQAAFTQGVRLRSMMIDAGGTETPE